MIILLVLVLAIASSIYVGIRAIRDREPAVSKTAPSATSNPAGADVRWSSIDDMQLTRLLQRAAQGD